MFAENATHASKLAGARGLVRPTKGGNFYIAMPDEEEPGAKYEIFGLTNNDYSGLLPNKNEWLVVPKVTKVLYQVRLKVSLKNIKRTFVRLNLLYIGYRVWYYWCSFIELNTAAENTRLKLCNSQILYQPDLRVFTSATAYFDSVDGRTPPRWPSTSLISLPACSGSFRRSSLLAQSSWRTISNRFGRGSNPIRGFFYF